MRGHCMIISHCKGQNHRSLSSYVYLEPHFQNVFWRITLVRVDRAEWWEVKSMKMINQRVSAPPSSEPHYYQDFLGGLLQCWLKQFLLISDEPTVHISFSDSSVFIQFSPKHYRSGWDLSPAGLWLIVNQMKGQTTLLVDGLTSVLCKGHTERSALGPDTAVCC